MPAYITVTSPISSDSWKKGISQAITWNSSLITDVRIDLFRDNGSTFDSSIVSSTPSDGSYNWSIPSGQSSRSDYQIRIRDVDYDISGVQDFSDSYIIYEAFNQILSESINTADSFDKSPTKVLSESISLSDAKVLKIIKAISEAIGISDSHDRAISRPLTDSISLSDTQVKKIIKVLSDSVGISESLERKPTVSKTDTISLTDAIIKQLTLILSDNVALSDAVLRQILRVLSDTVSLSDSQVLQITKVLQETVLIADIIDRLLLRPLSETVTLSDSYIRNIDRVISDSISISDTNVLNIVRVLSDSVNLTDSINIVDALEVLELYPSGGSESLNVKRKWGWIPVSDLSRKNIIRRLNIGYLSDDALIINIYADEENNPIFTKTLSIEPSIVEQSLKIGRRAHYFTLELLSDSSQNYNTIVESLEVEVDD